MPDDDTGHYGPHPAFGFLTRHVGPREECSGPDCGPDIDPFVDPDSDDTRREDEPGPWFIAGFDDVCSRGGEPIDSGDTIRADGDGGWECRECVDAGTDSDYLMSKAEGKAYDEFLTSGAAFGQDWGAA